jgi:hypothetical protein
MTHKATSRRALPLYIDGRPVLLMRANVIIIAVLNTICYSRAVFGCGERHPIEQLQDAIGHDVTVDDLVDIIRDDRDPLRQTAVRAIAEIGPDAGLAVPQLIQMLSENDDFLPGQAARALAAIGPDAFEAIPAVIDLITHQAAMKRESHNSVYAAIAALGEFGPRAEAAIPLLLGVMSAGDSTPELKYVAAIAVAKIGDKQKRGRDILSELANVTPDAIAPDDAADVASTLAVRIAAALALWRIHGEASVGRWLTRVASSSQVEDLLRAQAIDALGEIGQEASSAVPNLIEIAAAWEPSTPHYYPCTAAIRALGAIGPSARSAIPVLVDAFRRDPDGAVQQAVVEALGRVGPDAVSACAVINSALQSADWQLRISAAVATRRIAGATPEAVAVLRQALSVQRDECAASEFERDRGAAGIRRAAAMALAEFGRAAVSARGDLRTLQKDRFIGVRRAALQALQRIPRSDQAP